MNFIRQGSVLPPYMAYPRFLLDMDLPETARLIYVLLLDRARLSMKNSGWTDEKGQVYLYFTVEHLAQTAGKSTVTAERALAKLEKAGLIRRHHQGAGRPSRLYVGVPENVPREESEMKGRTGRKCTPSNKEKRIRTYEYEEGESL